MLRSLRLEPWPEGADVCVRIGIHSGEPALTETGYVGLAVHAAARVCSSAHGGQIVLSAATRDLAGAPLPGVSFRELGAHRLHGLPDAVALFQADADDLARDFPPPRTFTDQATDPSS
jgi:class 3 adenylate cyclase